MPPTPHSTGDACTLTVTLCHSDVCWCVCGNDHLHSQHIYSWQLIVHRDASERCTALLYTVCSHTAIPTPLMHTSHLCRHALCPACIIHRQIKIPSESEGCMLRQLSRGGAVTTAESVCHRVITFFFFPIVLGSAAA